MSSRPLPDYRHRPEQGYRPDLDGLRAISVGLVLFYHVGFKAVGGGFIGVDVFFVISGYLITRNILEQERRGDWSFGHFYLRRLRRLFPALAATIGLTLAFASLLFSPELLQRIAAESVAGLLSFSNLHFWLGSGYFDTANELKPLLHTWSLSVEEQFYLIWPVALILLTRNVPAHLHRAVLVLLGLCSLALAETLLDTDASAAFFLTPARIVEFVIGALCVGSRSPVRIAALARKPFVADFAVAMGLGLIVYSALTLTGADRFPGWAALTPCLGAALCILAGERARRVGRILHSPVAVTMGRLSYSLYLVHWPIIVFYRYWKLAPLSGTEQMALLLASCAAALALFHCVEEPLRRARPADAPARSGLHALAALGETKGFLRACATASCVLLLPAGLIWQGEGWPGRLGADARRPPAETPLRMETDTPGGFIGADRPGPADWLLIGDSHAGHLVEGLHALGVEENLKIHAFSARACQPILGATKIFPERFEQSQRDCVRYLNDLETLLDTHRYALVAIAGRWESLTQPEQYLGRVLRRDFLVDEETHETSLSATRVVFVRRLEEMARRLVSDGAKVVLFGQVPSLGQNPVDCLRVPTFLYTPAQLERRCRLPDYSVLRERVGYADARLAEIADRLGEGVESILLSEILCDAEEARCRFADRGASLYRDSHHLGPTGSRYVIQRSADRLRQLAARPTVALSQATRGQNENAPPLGK